MIAPSASPLAGLFCCRSFQTGVKMFKQGDPAGANALDARQHGTGMAGCHQQDYVDLLELKALHARANQYRDGVA
jgi:hypothetical protein